MSNLSSLKETSAYALGVRDFCRCLEKRALVFRQPALPLLGSKVRSLSDKQCHPRGQNAKSSSPQAEIKAIRRFGSDRGASFPGSRSILRRRPCSSLAYHIKRAIHDPGQSEAIRGHGYIHCILTRCAAVCGADHMGIKYRQRSKSISMYGGKALCDSRRSYKPPG